ncbi:Pyruvate:ferredoxin oxidoreductase, beta subunit [Candidatus Kryptobacter tengchongensis]|nr:Pyruvate:ferredoxin oxidoreductase, beta subunit [Candidatus Kryptobacter tengchongensis]
MEDREKQVENISTNGGQPLEDIYKDIIDVEYFNEVVVGAYNRGIAEEELPADIYTARSIIPAVTGALRDFSYIAPEIPLFNPDNCVGCMECVTECPDTAILGKVVPESKLEEELNKIQDPVKREHIRRQFAKTTKYYEVPKKKGIEPGLFMIAVDPTKCKGCAECVSACGDHNALQMIKKTGENLKRYREVFEFYTKLPETPKEYIQEKVLADMMLAGKSLLYVGGAGSCMGCGEATAIRMMLAATGFVYGPENIGIVAATGCNTVYSSTYPYNPFRVPWINSLFENAPAVAIGIRARWDQMGWQHKRLWVIGGDGAMYDIGFQSLSRMLASGMDIKVLVLDTQVYSNTGGQSSTSSYLGQDTKLSAYGKEIKGKSERRKELAQIVMMHPDVFVAQTTPAHINHFYRSILSANEFQGPAVVIVYTTCQPEHGVGDDMAMQQAKLAVESRAFPLLIYDPRKGETIKERLSLQGNPALKDDWYVHPKTGEVIDFIYFARTEGRFAKHFDKDGNPDEMLLQAQEDRLKNWRLLQELAGLR